MKVGTDGVLLGAWVGIEPSIRRVLDIGTGTGVIALMIAQRSDAEIIGIDICDVSQAVENAVSSIWNDRVKFVQSAVQNFDSPKKFDLILSNPPYFINSLQSDNAERTAARHTTELPFEHLRDAVLRLLTIDGRFAVILPAVESERFDDICAGRLFAMRRTYVRTTAKSVVKRILTEYSTITTDDCINDELIIGTGEHECYTDQYKSLTHDFYLKF